MKNKTFDTLSDLIRDRRPMLHLDALWSGHRSILELAHLVLGYTCPDFHLTLRGVHVVFAKEDSNVAVCLRTLDSTDHKHSIYFNMSRILACTVLRNTDIVDSYLAEITNFAYCEEPDISVLTFKCVRGAENDVADFYASTSPDNRKMTERCLVGRLVNTLIPMPA